MAKNIEMKVGSVLTRVNITDDSGEVLGWLKINLSDARIISRIHDCALYFRDLKIEDNGADGLAKLDAEMEDKFSYLLGYDCRENLFGVLSPTTVFRNGEMFAVSVLETISGAYSEEAKERAAARVAAVRKYTDKYSS